VTVFAFNRPFTEQLVAIGTVFVRPLLAEALYFSRFGGGHVFSVRRHGNIVMADIALADPLGLMPLVIKNHAVLEINDIGCSRTGRYQRYYYGQFFQIAPPEYTIIKVVSAGLESSLCKA